MVPGGAGAEEEEACRDMAVSRQALDRATARIRVAVRACLESVRDPASRPSPSRGAGGGLDPDGQAGPVAVALSGGPDSLALAAAAAFVAPRCGRSAAAIVVDHGLQPDSAAVAARAADSAALLGLDPVRVVRVSVPGDDPAGPEAAARTVRYRALSETAAAIGATDLLVGHTLDDQAESVLLGLARGSGPASLAGMRSSSVVGGIRLLRPLLGVRRADTIASCAALGLEPWTDPQNADERYLRVLVRRHTLPVLEDDLGPGVAPALARTARLVADDADLLDAQAADAFPTVASPLAPAPDGQGSAAAGIVLDRVALAGLHPALRRRIYRKAAAELSGASLAAVHADEIDRMVTLASPPTRLDLPGTKVERVRTRIILTPTR